MCVFFLIIFVVVVDDNGDNNQYVDCCCMHLLCILYNIYREYSLFMIFNLKRFIHLICFKPEHYLSVFDALLESILHK